MKKTLTYFTAAAVLLAAAGCAKEKSQTTNEAAKRYFEAWMHVHHPDVGKTGLGIYILDDEPNADEESRLDFADAGYLFVKYTSTDLQGNITATNDEETAKRLGNYDRSYYYGPAVWTYDISSTPAGIMEMLAGMKTGDRRTAVIPGWLMSYKDYGTEEEYLKNVTDGTSAIYTVQVVDSTDNIFRKQIEMIENFEYRYTDNDGNEQVWKVSPADTVYYGFYYKEICEGTEIDEEDRKEDEEGNKLPYKALNEASTVDIKYTGSLLNGQVFDTTDEKTAKDNYIYSSSKTYGATEATWASDSTSVRLGSSSVITGFSSTMCRMKYYGARGIGIFISAWGYGVSGSGSAIPGYAPLVFDVEIESDEED